MLRPCEWAVNRFFGRSGQGRRINVTKLRSGHAHLISAATTMSDIPPSLPNFAQDRDTLLEAERQLTASPLGVQ